MESVPYSAKMVEVESSPFSNGVEPFRVGGDVVVEVVTRNGRLVQRYQSMEGSRRQSQIEDIGERKRGNDLHLQFIWQKLEKLIKRKTGYLFGQLRMTDSTVRYQFGTHVVLVVDSATDGRRSGCSVPEGEDELLA